MQKPKECRGCPLENRGLGFSRPEGSGKNGVLVVGESLGWEEYLDGLPFRPHAQAGSALEKGFKLAGFERHDFKLWDIIGCHPPNNKIEGVEYGEGAIEHCKIHFNRVLEKHCNDNSNPVILALGNVPLKVLTGVSGDPKEKQSISNLRGYVLPATQYPGVHVVSSFHPSFIKRGNANLYPALMDDMAKAVEVASGKFDWFKGGIGFVEPCYQTHPSISEVELFVRMVEQNSGLVLGMDIETQESFIEEDERGEIKEDVHGWGKGKIELMQFSVGKGTGIAIPFTLEYLSFIKRLCKVENQKLGFNWWEFDAPRVRDSGIEVTGQVHDLMIMFSKFNPTLRRGLQAVASYAKFPFPWKHLYGVNLEYYGCADVDALHWIWEWLPGEMKQLGCWKQYKEQVYDFKTILDRASVVGIPVDDVARVALQSEMVCEATQRVRSAE